MPISFVPALRAQSHARIALVGPPGSGKTYSALRIAAGLGCQRIALIDSERKKSLKQSGKSVAFNVAVLENHAPRTYCEALEAAAKAGFDGLIIDSLSDEWEGDGGMLSKVEEQAGDSSDERGVWRKLNPEHTHLFDLILQYPGHVIGTVRARKAREPDRRKPKELEPLQREGWDYQFDLVGMLDFEHRLTLSKSCVEALPRGSVVPQPGVDFGRRFAAWLRGGDARASEPSNVVNGVAAAAVATGD